jgi:hypothetical protein
MAREYSSDDKQPASWKRNPPIGYIRPKKCHDSGSNYPRLGNTCEKEENKIQNLMLVCFSYNIFIV